MYPFSLKLPAHACCYITVRRKESCLTLCSPMDCNPPVSSVHGIFQARILEWVAIPFSRGSSPPRDQTLASRIAGRLFAMWATRAFPVNNIKALFESASLRPKRFRTTALLFGIYSKGPEKSGPLLERQSPSPPTPAVIFHLLGLHFCLIPRGFLHMIVWEAHL